eukprot:scaffold83_cov181-Amphora_coffeaeformis.AAC.17
MGVLGPPKILSETTEATRLGRQSHESVHTATWLVKIERHWCWKTHRGLIASTCVGVLAGSEK